MYMYLYEYIYRERERKRKRERERERERERKREKEREGADQRFPKRIWRRMIAPSSSNVQAPDLIPLATWFLYRSRHWFGG